MNLHDLITFGIGDKDTLSIFRWVIGVFSLSAFLILFKVRARAYPTTRARIGIIMLRIGFLLHAIYYFLASAGQVKPSSNSVNLTPILLMVFIGGILVAIGMCFVILDSIYRVHEIPKAPNQKLQEATG